jgi:hypothetical protein
MRRACWLSAYDGHYECVVDAGSAEGAAAEAARVHGMAGDWTVVQTAGPPVVVTVEHADLYKAVSMRAWRQ